ncbi:MAG: PssD/Cps14F family polysaccharide biosynthesis glycosyltransferase [Methanoregula sp.]
MKKNKICLVCGPGGHFVELLRLLDAVSERNIFFVTVKTDTTKVIEKRYPTYFLRDRFESQKKFNRTMTWMMTFLYGVVIFMPSFKIYLKERPNVIITIGGDETIPICIIGKIFGSKIICIESFTRIHFPSGTGLILYPISDLFLVQWESLLQKYGKKAQYWGKVL